MLRAKAKMMSVESELRLRSRLSRGEVTCYVTEQNETELELCPIGVAIKQKQVLLLLTLHEMKPCLPGATCGDL